MLCLVCGLAIRDFTIDEDWVSSGFDWSLGASISFDYELACLLDGLMASLGYDFSYVGISRFETPTNLEEDGPARIDRTHQPRHMVGVSLSYSF